MKSKIKVLVILCMVSLVVAGIAGYCVVIDKDLSINEIEKYSNNINIKYGIRSNYGYNSYILNINNNNVTEATKSVVNYSDNKYEEFDGYHVAKIKGIKAVYDIDNNVVLNLDILAKNNGYKNYECTLLKYDKTDKLMYLLIHESYPKQFFVMYDMNTGRVEEITKIGNKYNNELVNFSYELNNSTIYILNDENELCEYNFDIKEFKNLQIKPKCYSVADEKIIYLDNDYLYEYNIVSTNVKKLFKLKGFIIDIFVDRNANFILVIEELIWRTNIFDRFLQWPTHNMNCLKIYELSTGKSKVLVPEDNRHYVTWAEFLE